jgi:hypothetical protein
MRKRIDEDRESVGDSSFMGSSIAGSDYGFAMKQWLRETESIMGDYSPCQGPVLCYQKLRIVFADDDLQEHYQNQLRSTRVRPTVMLV